MSNRVQSLIRSLRNEANYLFFRRYRYWRIVYRHLRKYYTPEARRSTIDEHIIIYMADGRYLHGGFADRLRSILTDYRYCRDHSIRFAINFTFPFKLEDYLEPAAYDWRLQPGELTYNSRQACAVFTDTAVPETPREMAFCKRLAAHALGRDYQQIHAYGALYYDDSDFATLWNELFRPTAPIRAEIQRHLTAIGGEYVSVSTRFMELLGDFTEPKHGIAITPDDRQQLIDHCLAMVDDIHQRHPEAKRILVTSDSRRFLNACESRPYVYVIPGVIAHSDTATSSDHTKTFVDFLMISHATKAYQIVGGGMYGGNFSLRASQIAGKPYERIEFSLP
jgi:hypothetical protein